MKISNSFCHIVLAIIALVVLSMTKTLVAQSLDYELEPIPETREPLPENSIQVGDSKSFDEVKLDLPITTGPYQPTWESIEENYPGTPDWLRKAKFGLWVHFGPQSAGESGDWYARRLYTPGTTAYTKHLENFGHPSEVGYKEVLRDWNPEKLDPEKLVEIYKDAGVRYLIIQGVHHDQFDMWKSKYQPWNSVHIGPKRDLVEEWKNAARKAGIRFGLTFHHEYSWWWWQTAFQSDTEGAYAGIPYDGNLTLADGVGKWWEGMDPRLLYGINLREYEGVAAASNSNWSPPSAGIFSNHLLYAEWYSKWWALRMMDAVDQYAPDFIYTDGTDQQPFSGYGTGTGFRSDAMQRVIADFYNKTLERRGKVDVFSIVKFRDKTNGTVNTQEGNIPSGIKTDQAWIAENPVGDWFYAPDFYYSSDAVIRYLIEQVSRDGNVGLSVALLPDGSMDQGSEKMLKEIGAWMKINGEGIYGSYAWKVLGEGANGNLNVLPGGKIGWNQANHQFSNADFRFTVGENDSLYAWCMIVPSPGTILTITSLGTNSDLLTAPIATVELLGYDGTLTWKQDADGLKITCPNSMDFKTAIAFKIGPGIYNYTELNELIQDGQALIDIAEKYIGSNTGQYIPEKVNVLKATIVKVQAIDQDSDYETVKAGIQELKDVIAKFKENGQVEGGVLSFDSLQNITNVMLGEARNFSRSDEVVFGNGRWGLLAEPWKYSSSILNQEGGSRGGFDNYGESQSIGIQKWEASLPGIENGMIYQTTTLPAGSYQLKINVHEAFGFSPGEVYLNVAEGKILPVTSEVQSEAIAYFDMSNASTGEQLTVCDFSLSSSSEVSIGFTTTIPSSASQRSMRVNEILLLDGNGNDVSSSYLGNYTDIQRKDISISRFGTPEYWEVDNFECQTGNEGLRNGIDRWSGYNSLMMGFWGDRANALGDPSNAKLYQKITLPKGDYIFTAGYDANYNLPEMYMFVSENLPDLSTLKAEALSFQSIAEAPTTGEHYGLKFSLDKESTIYVGWLGDLTTASNCEFRAIEVNLSRILSDESPFLPELTFDASKANYDYELNSTQFESLNNLLWKTSLDNVSYIEGNENGTVVVGDFNFGTHLEIAFFVYTAFEGYVPDQSSYDFYLDHDTVPIASVSALSAPSSFAFDMMESDNVAIEGIHRLKVKYNGHSSNLFSIGMFTSTQLNTEVLKNHNSGQKPYFCYFIDGNIIIRGLKDEVINIYSLDGKKIFGVKANRSLMNIPVMTGVYLVEIAKNIYKVPCY